MRRTRGFTLMEILIAMALTTIVTASVLAIVRTQLTAFEMQDQLVRTQQNTRAGMDFVENMVRKACGGINSGFVYVYTPTLVSTTGVPCLRVTDGATIGASSFTSASANNPDALEVVYASGALTTATNLSALSSTSPSVQVQDICNFSKDDYVIITDTSYANPSLFKISSVSAGTCPSSTQVPGTLTFYSVSTAPSATLVAKYSAYVAGTTAGSPVFKASTYAIFVVPALPPTTYSNMLMIDPDGVASNNHLAYGTSVQPAVEGVVDFQVAVGNDTSGTGSGTMNWIGDSWGELPLMDPTATPWNSSTLTTMPQYRQVRISMLLRTSNYYPGTPGAITPLEDRPFSSYPTFTPGHNSQRYRSMSTIVAPRAWNLSE